MSNQLPAWATEEFSTNVQIVAQQMGASIFRPLVMEGKHTGESASPVNLLQPFDFQDPPGRFAPKVYTNPGMDRRWVDPTDKEVNVPIDPRDEVRTIVDPRGAYVEEGAAATGRLQDRIIIPAFFADAKTGKIGGSTTPFLSTNVVLTTVGGSTGMNTTKLEAIIQLFLANRVDFRAQGGLSCAIGSVQNANLLREIEIARDDYKKGAVIMDGLVMSYLGIRFVHTEELPTDASSYRRCPVWTRRGMHFGVWMEATWGTHVEQSLSFDPTILGGKAIYGATRTEEKLVAEIKTAES